MVGFRYPAIQVTSAIVCDSVHGLILVDCEWLFVHALVFVGGRRAACSLTMCMVIWTICSETAGSFVGYYLVYARRHVGLSLLLTIKF